MDDYLEQGYADALKEFPALAVHEGTSEFEPVLYLAVGLMDGGMPGEIEEFLKYVMPSDPAEYEEFIEDADWIEDGHGGARYARDD